MVTTELIIKAMINPRQTIEKIGNYHQTDEGRQANMFRLKTLQFFKSRKFVKTSFRGGCFLSVGEEQNHGLTSKRNMTQ